MLWEFQGKVGKVSVGKNYYPKTEEWKIPLFGLCIKPCMYLKFAAAKAVREKKIMPPIQE